MMTHWPTVQNIRKLLIAGHGELAIRVMRAATELGIRKISVHSNEDRFALHRFKADESYLAGAAKKPIQACQDIEDILRITKETRADAIHPGYGLPAGNPDFAQACAKNDIASVGPTPEVTRTPGNKAAARCYPSRQ